MTTILIVAGAILITATAACVCALILAGRIDDAAPRIQRITSVDSTNGKVTYTTKTDGHKI